jgi:hypothetical protein
VLGYGTTAFSILLSSKPVHLDLKVTSDLVRMRRRVDGRPKLGGPLSFSVHCAAVESLALSGAGASGGPWVADRPYTIGTQHWKRVYFTSLRLSCLHTF